MISGKDEIKTILEKYNIVAIVGLSRDPSKESYIVAEYLKEAHYKIVPINPSADEILREKCYKSLLDMPEDLKKAVQVVDVFRPSAELDSIVGQAIQLRRAYGKPNVIWMQIGIVNEEAAKNAVSEGLIVVMDKCIMIEHHRTTNL